ncbi:hypothetical protein RJT34_22065 [Clitoria ternatea]|uniref:E3 ubiquitin-protein ligase PRT1 n=1 Tax=Clitoria ternatea TaxID=43366 RepID=A0AAN9P6S8_CLITE
MENNAFKDENQHHQTFEPFVCCVCLDLLYKPIVLSCGHISCFWCVHKSMNGVRESHCPICRHPYCHFPTICQKLHFLLLKMYPDAYKNREKQTLEEERNMGCFSPQFNVYTHGSHVSDHSGIMPNCTITNQVSNSSSIEPLECLEQTGSAIHKGDEDTTIYSEHTSNETPEVFGTTSDEGKKLFHNEHNQQQKILIEDVMCTFCKQLLFHPVVLNCGHVYCDTCIINLAEEMLKCPVCQSPHPSGSPKVCLVLDHFLEEQFPAEYAQRRDAIQQSNLKAKPETTSCSLHNGKGEKITNPRLEVHTGVGCDFCGVYPITGDRYNCLDCKEVIGFDLCGDCYKIRSKLPGRFNQQHTPEHQFQRVQYLHAVRSLLREQNSLENFLIIAQDTMMANEEDDQNDSEAGT